MDKFVKLKCNLSVHLLILFGLFTLVSSDVNLNGELIFIQRMVLC